MSKDRYQGKFSKVMREFKAGQLRHGSTGQVVKRDDVAKAIAHSEASKVEEGARKKRKKRRNRRGNLSRVLRKHYGGENG